MMVRRATSPFRAGRTGLDDEDDGTSSADTVWPLLLPGPVAGTLPARFAGVFPAAVAGGLPAAVAGVLPAALAGGAPQLFCGDAEDAHSAS
ncbi:hypothetical protein GCM10010298_12820 [Streptomyces microflavus]|nr:hypothetical protein GCM10010298_12820 [Streptomyces microflavus]